MFLVLRCEQCKMYQNHQQSAKTKFKCKVCNASNQKRIYFADPSFVSKFYEFLCLAPFFKVEHSSVKTRKMVQSLNMPASETTKNLPRFSTCKISNFLIRSPAVQRLKNVGKFRKIVKFLSFQI